MTLLRILVIPVFGTICDATPPGIAGQLATSGTTIRGDFLVTNNVVDLLAINTTRLPDRSTLNLLGYYLASDGGGGMFHLDKSSVTPGNGGSCFIPTDGPGRWIRQIQDAQINVRWFGAKGDNSTNDTVNIQKAVKAALSWPSQDESCTILFPKGTFVIQGNGALFQSGTTTTPKRFVTFRGQGGGSTKIKFLATGSSNSYLYDTISQRDFEHATFHDIYFTSNNQSLCSLARINGTLSASSPGGIHDTKFTFLHCFFDSLHEVMRNDGVESSKGSGFRGCGFGKTNSILTMKNARASSIDFVDCDGSLHGPLVRISGVTGGAGGNINVYGGNFSQLLGELVTIDNTATTATPMPINFHGARVELYGKTTLFTVAGGIGQTQLNFDNSLIFVSARGNKLRVVGNLVENTTVSFNNCNVDYGCQFQLNALPTTTHAHNLGLLIFNKSAIWTGLSENIFFSSGAGRARATNCFGFQGNVAAQPNNNTVVDFDLNAFKDGGLQNSDVHLKSALLFNTGVSNWPTSNGNPAKTLRLPSGALLKGIRVYKPAAGNDSSPYQIKVGNDAQTVTYGQSKIAPANQIHTFDVDLSVAQLIDTGSGENRTLKIWATGGGSSAMRGGFAIVDYY